MSEDAGPRQAWTMAVLLWIAIVGITANEIAPASVLLLIAGDLGIGSTGVSWLVSAFLLGMVAFSLPTGFLLDRVNNRHVVLVVGLLILSLSAWATLAAQAETFEWLIVARVLGGVVSVVLWTVAINLVGSAFGSHRQGTSLGFITASVPAGFAVAHTTGPTLSDWIGWEASFVIFGSLTFLSATAFWVYARDIQLQTSFTTPSREEFVTVLGNRWVWAVSAMGFAAYSLNMFFNNLLPSYLVDRFGLSLAVGGFFAAVFPAIGAVARFSSGAISDRLFGGRRSPIVFGSFVVLTPLIVLVANLRSIAILLAMLVIAGFATQMGLALLIAYVRELVAENVAATSISVLNLVGLSGAFSAPVLTGLLIDHAGTYVAAFAYATGLGVVGIALSWVTPEP